MMTRVTGIIPAAGKATRLHGLPKFLLPIPEGHLLGRIETAMDVSGIGNRVVVASRETYPFVQAYAHAGSLRSIVSCFTMTEAVLKVRRYACNDYVIMAMPDTYFEDTGIFSRLVEALDSGADLALGVFYARRSQKDKLGMVATEDGRVINVVDKPAYTLLNQAWGVMAWRWTFWRYLQATMPHTGYGIMPAVAAGLDVRTVQMYGWYWDCGTFDEYAGLGQHLTERVSII